MSITSKENCPQHPETKKSGCSFWLGYPHGEGPSPERLAGILTESRIFREKINAAIKAQAIPAKQSKRRI